MRNVERLVQLCLSIGFKNNKILHFWHRIIVKYEDFDKIVQEAEWTLKAWRKLPLCYQNICFSPTNLQYGPQCSSVSQHCINKLFS